MNKLSWTIYLANVAPSFVGMVMALIFFATLFWLVYSIISYLWALENTDSRNTTTRDRTLERLNKGLFPSIKGQVFLVVLFCLLTLVPDKDAIYMIAASEFGEMAVETPEARELLNDVHEVIKYQLNQLKGQ